MQLSVFLFAAVASAYTHFTRQDDPSTTYRMAIASIAHDVQAYTTQVTTFSGISNRTTFVDAISQLEDTVSESITTIQTLPSLDEEDTMIVSIDILNLDDSIKAAITNTTNQQILFSASCLGPTILQFLQTAQTSLGTMILQLSTKLDPSFQDIINNVHDDFLNAFQTGIDTFADPTSWTNSVSSTTTKASSTSGTKITSSLTTMQTSTTCTKKTSNHHHTRNSPPYEYRRKPYTGWW
ncbi:hypothetical protein AC579_9495 [Pseudocercospora musae]|uniref:Cell wall galactomannoprotein n=1 Tax=Pseudocercospora musae TaxID=113226 RepID=A0A139I5E2_9PEZI|nr:hypothetical protein AC579_9495 [Pseudocercospora musae]